MSLHPHHDLIIAYLEDKQVQYKNGLDQWIDIPKLSAGGGIMPPFHHISEYRLKPIVKPNVIFKLKAKMIGKDVVVRYPDHWEPENLLLEFDGNTHKLVGVQILND
jgi:hypothetical protein